MKKYLISGFNTVQDVKLEAGTYTLVAYAKSMYSNVYTFALWDGENWTEYDIDVVKGQLCKVWLTFTIDKKATKFKPIANNFTESLPVYVTDLQLTKGNIPVEAGASPFDIDQILNDLHDGIDGIEDFTNEAFMDGLLSREEKTQLRSSLEAIGTIVESVKGSYDKLLDNPFISDATMNDITEKYYALIASWISDGDPRGLKPVILWIVHGDNIVSQNEREEKDRALNAFNDALYAYNQAEKEVYNDVGANSIAPIITEDGFWAFWDSELQEFVKSEFSSIGDDAHSPYVDALTGTWWEWNPNSTPPAYRDTGIKAEGKDGISASLTNDNITIKVNSLGDPISLASAKGKYIIYSGGFDVSDSSIFYPPTTVGCTISMNQWGEFEITAIDSTETSIYADFSATYSGTTITKRLTISVVKDGYTPIKGTDYFDGKDGQDGTSEHLHIRYSMSPDGSNFDIDPSNKLYIGIATSTTGVAPTLKTEYNWTLIKGSDGVKGEKGTDGESRYLHIKYSDNGTSFTANMGETLGSWIGMYVDNIEEDSTRFDDYTWRKVDGEDGKDGIVVALTNPNIQIKLNSSGSPTNLASAKGFLEITKGGYDVSDNAIFYEPTSNNCSVTMDRWGEYEVTNIVGTEDIYSDLRLTYNGVTYTRRLHINTVSDGEDGKEGAGTETIYILGNTYPSTPSGNNPSGWVKFPLTPTKSQKYVYVSTRSKPEGGVWGAWSSPAVYTIFIEALDAAVPAVSYMDGEWAIGRTFIRDDYSFPLVTYLKGTGDRPLFYYLNKKGTYFASSIADSPQNNSSGANPLWRYVENVDMLISDSVFTGMLKLSDSNFLETAGGSGHTGVMGTLPALWAGGTYNEAKRLMNLLDAIRYGGNPVGKTANFVVNHSGAAKLGIFVIDQSGRVNLIDPMSGNPFGSISNHPIPLYSDMLLNEYSESSAMNLEKTFWYNDNNILLPNSVTTVRAGGDIEFTATATFSGSIPFSGSAYVELILRRNGVYYQTIYSDFFESKKVPVGTPSLDFTNTVEINEKLIDVPYGVYDILFKSEYIMAANSCKLELSESFLVWTYTPKDSKTVQIGKNGFMAWFGADKHIHLSDTEGLKIKGIAADSVTGAITTAFARVASNAAMSDSTSYLRAGLSLHSSKSSIGKYRLSHNLNKLKYVCHVTPTQAARSASIILQDSYYIDIEFRNEMGDLSDSSFSFSIIELNN